MIVRIEISDYENKDPIADPKIIVRDAGHDSGFVRITVSDKTVKVDADEMISAIKRCQNAQWPY